MTKFRLENVVYLICTGVDLSECEEPCPLSCTTDKLGIYSCFCERGYELTDYTECTGELGVGVCICTCACMRVCAWDMNTTIATL